jgi:hypothetical protein
VSFDRTSFAKALATALEAELAEAGVTATVFDKPPFTLNAPSIVIARPTEVRYSEAAFSIDAASVAVTCIGAADDDETVGELIGVVRSAIGADASLGGAVALCVPMSERNWTHVNVAGTDLLRADVVLDIQM